jgi:putative ABC transport system substrate-binding protein
MLAAVGLLVSQPPLAEPHLFGETRACGSVVGRHHRIVAADTERARSYVAELVALAPDVILSTSGTILPALLDATRVVPIVFLNVADPVGAGFVASLARPSGNVTGFLAFEYGISGKWRELLKQFAPSVTRAAVIRDPGVAAGIGQFGALQSAAPSFGVELTPINLRDADEIERGIAAFARSSNGGLIVTTSPVLIRADEVIE